MTSFPLEVTAEALASIDLFADLSFYERSQVAHKCRRFSFETDQFITSQQDGDDAVYFILSGAVRLTVYSLSGREITFRDQCAGETFGELAAIDNKPRSACAVALTPTTVAAMSAPDFLWMMQLHPSIMLHTLERLAALVRSLSERVVEFTSLNVKNRIHAELLRLAWNNMDSANRALIFPAPKHLEIASRISAHREAITRELNQLASEGLLQKGDDGLLIKDVLKLENMVRDSAGVYRKGKP